MDVQFFGYLNEIAQEGFCLMEKEILNVVCLFVWLVGWLV
jgi:hypothetical protein